MKKLIRSEERIYFPIVFYEGIYVEEPFRLINELIEEDDCFE
jgi:hypothetical protein